MGQPSPRDIVMQTLQNLEEKRIEDSYNAPDLPLDVFKSMANTPPRKPPTYSESNPVTGEGTLDAFDAQYNKIQLELNKYIRESGKYLQHNESNGLWYEEDEYGYKTVDSTASDMQSVLDNIYMQAQSLQSSLKGSGSGSAGAFMDSAAMQADEGDRAYKDYVSRVSDWAALNEADFSREREIANAFRDSQQFTIERNQAIQEGLLTPWAAKMGFRPPPREEGFNEFGSAIRSTIPSEAPGYVPYAGPNFVPRGYAGGTGNSGRRWGNIGPAILREPSTAQRMTGWGNATPSPYPLPRTGEAPSYTGWGGQPRVRPAPSMASAGPSSSWKGARGYAMGTGEMAMQPRVPGQPVGLVKNFTPPPATQMMPPQGMAPVAAGPQMNPPPSEPDLVGKIPLGPVGMTAAQRLQRYTNASN